MLVMLYASDIVYGILYYMVEEEEDSPMHTSLDRIGASPRFDIIYNHDRHIDIER